MDRESRDGRALTRDQVDHLNRIEAEISTRIVEKYIQGAREHGTFLPNQPGILDMAIEEVLDLAVYLLTLKEQQEQRNASDAG